MREPEPVLTTQEVVVPGGAARLAGDLTVPAGARGAVLFAHGALSGRASPRGQSVARELAAAGFATLLLDLLSADEARDRRRVFDTELLAERLLDATAWLRQQPATRGLPLAYFGASTGAAAALQAAALGDAVAAVVSRSGRPDLALRYLAAVRAPTLLIVGGEDRPMLALNQVALTALQCPKRLAVVPGATHLFEEPGALAAVAQLAVEWLGRHLLPPGVGGH